MTLLEQARRTVKGELLDLRESFQQLSALGRLQVALLLTNVVLTTVLLNIGASVVEVDSVTPTSAPPPAANNSANVSTTTAAPQSAQTEIDYTTLAVSLEFAVFSLFGILYTVSVESMFAFWGLVIVEVELAAFVTGAASIGVLKSLWLKWVIVALNWTCIAAFLLLQLVVRKSWGWHAYKQVGGGVESIQLYRRYQMLCAAIVGDAFHTLFFITCEEIIIRNTSAEQHWLVYGFCIPAVLLTFPLVLSVRKGYRAVSALIYLQYLAGLGNFLFFTIVNTISVFDGDEDNLRKDAESHFNTENQQLLVMLAEWCIVVARIAFLVLALPVIASPNISSIFGKGAFSGLLLSKIAGEEALLNDAASDTQHTNHHHPRRRLLVQIEVNDRRRTDSEAPLSSKDDSPVVSGEPPISPTRTTRTSHPRRKNSFGSQHGNAGSPVIGSTSVRESLRGRHNAIAVIDVSHRSQSLIGQSNRGSVVLSGTINNRSGGGVVGDSTFTSSARPAYYGSSNAASFHDDNVAMTPNSQSKLSDGGAGGYSSLE